MGIVAAVVAAVASSGIASARITAAGITTSGVAATRIAAAGIAAAAAAVADCSAWGLFALEVDGVDDGVGALGGFDGFDEGLLAVSVDAVGEDDDGFAAGLFVHEFVGGEEEGVVEGGPPPDGGWLCESSS